MALSWRRVERMDHPDAYVRKVLVNQARMRWRRRSTREIATADLPDLPVPDGAAGRADRADLMAALGRLPARQRAVVVLRYFEQLSEAETASALGCATGTVKSQCHKALRNLRTHLSPEEDPCQTWS